LPAERLHALQHDDDLRIRFTVAERCQIDLLSAFLEDKDELVRACAQTRLAEG
jgi:hypothetical protein